jgi:hypothetical protein
MLRGGRSSRLRFIPCNLFDTAPERAQRGFVSLGRITLLLLLLYA